VNDYWQIKQLEASPEYTRYWDAEAKAPYLYAPTKHQGHMISYEDQQSLALKLQYVAKHKLGGVMFWELSGDDHKVPQSSLLKTIHDHFHPAP